MNSLLYDFRFALRQLARHRGFSLIAVATLAIGIAAATIVFSLVDAVLLRPLPFKNPDSIVAVDTVVKSAKQAVKQESYTSWPDFFDVRRENKSLVAVVGYRVSNMSLGRPGAALRRISGMEMSAGMVRVLGISMALGRDFAASEELAGNRSVILTDGLWRNDFGTDTAIVGKQIQLDGVSHTVVGVLPRGFVLPVGEDAQYWVTEGRDAEGSAAETTQRGQHMLQVVGRLRVGVTAAAAQAELTRIQMSLNAQFPNTDAQNDHVAVTPLGRALTGDVRQPLRILLAAVGFLLLIACVNVAGLLLTRAVSRQGELAVRAALGASRTALLRQLLLEAMTLAMAGGVAGTVLAAAALAMAPKYLPKSLPHASSIALDGRVLLFAVGTSVVTGLVFGVLPAWRASRMQPAEALQGNSRSSTAGRGRGRLHGGLVVLETALSMLLLVGAGLLLRSFERVLSVDPGFETRGLLSFRVAVPANHFATDEQQVQFAAGLQERLAALPGVTGATYAQPMPLAGGNMRYGFTLAGHPTPPGEGLIARLSTVPPNFFETMRIPLLRGRTFTTTENQPKGPAAAVVNEAFAQKFFPAEDPLNKRISSGAVGAPDTTNWQIVGVVGNIKRKDLTEATEPEYYLPIGANFLGTPTFALRTAGEPMQFADTVRKLVAEQDAALPVFNAYSYDTLMERSNAQRRFQTVLITGFAAVALLLAAIGLYASLSYMVVERTAELGLRMALGAQRDQVLLLVLRRGMGLAVAGLALGLVAAAGLTRFVSSLLYGTQPLDAVTFASTTVILFGVCAAASVTPAWRASRLNPNETLRGR